jgi:hypothetical protein
MLQRQTGRLWIACSLAAGVLLLAILSQDTQIFAISPLTSQLPPVEAPGDWMPASGGRRAFGLPASPIWLDFPEGYTSAQGASVLCDITGVTPVVGLSNYPLFPITGNQGYLVRIDPQVPLSKALKLVVQFDPTRLENLCMNCIVGRYYDPQSRRWRSLPTKYDPRTARVSVTISSYPPRGRYPGSEDRLFFALFAR